MSKFEEKVIEKIMERAKVGEGKYGVTMERKDLSIVEWLVHLQEELMDAAVYVERLIADCSCHIHGTEPEQGCPYCRRL
tara:strand:+ start:10432 stop:10668 length:237 start_codon:yes stop_codon:yes gene_type:complete